MKYILDTHTIIRMFENDANLSIKVKNIIKNKLNDCFVSILSFKEIAIKTNIGKLELNNSLRNIYNELKEQGINIIPIGINHLEELINLKLVIDHKDPFDRLLIATAISENLNIISIDKKFDNYTDLIDIIW
jgi:PIN domain nuclease of toxin-antitoxin system